MNVLTATSPTLPHTETFNYSDGPAGRPLYISSANATPQVVGGRLTSPGLGFGWHLNCNVRDTPARVSVDVTGSFGAAGYVHAFCGADREHGVSADLTATHVFLFTSNNGTTQVATAPYAAVTPFTLTVEKSGSTYSALVNGVSVLSWTGAAQWGRVAAVWMGDTNTLFADNLTATA